jgi:hypothetical protein
MKAVAHAYNLLHGGAYNRVERHEDRLAYIIDDRGFPYAPRMDPSQMRFAMVSVLIFLHALLVLISDDGLHRRLRKRITSSHSRRWPSGSVLVWPP